MEARQLRIVVRFDVAIGASLQAATRVNAAQAWKGTAAQADPMTLSGKADTAGELSETIRPAQSMIRKSVQRFSEKIMLKRKDRVG